LNNECGSGGNMKRLIFTLVVCVLAPPAFSQTQPATEAPAPIKIETFAATPFMEDPELSPNGQWLATKLAKDGKQILAMIPLYDKAATPVTFALDGAKIDVDRWRWVNDDWLLVNVTANIIAQGNEWRGSRVLSLSRATGAINELAWKDAAQNAGDVIWVAKDGTPRILLAVQNSIFSNVNEFWPQVLEVDVSTGKTKQVVGRNENVFQYFADASGAVRIAYGYNDDVRIGKLLYRSSGKGDFKQIDRAKFGKDEELSFPALFLPEVDKSLTADDADGYNALYELDLKTMTRGKRLFGVAGYDVNGLIRTPVGDGLVGVSVTENRYRINWLDPKLAKVQAEMDKAVGVGNANVVSWDRDFQKLLVKIGGPDQAGAYYINDLAQGGVLQRIGFVHEALKMRKMSPVKTIKYKARDDLEISAILTLPKDREAKNLPLIVLPHGGPGARDDESWDWWVQFLAWKGYAVVQPNYRGSTGYGTAFLEKGKGEWGLKMQDDLNDAVMHLAKQGIADPKRVCMVGASYGGYAAFRAAQRDGAIYKCAVSFAGVADIAAIARFDRRFVNGNSNTAYWKESAPNSSDVSPTKHADMFSIPMLIIHGKNDLRVPVSQSREMAAKLKAAGKIYRYVEQPLGDHHFSREADRLQFLKEMDAFLQQYNPA
jgi:dipeptidyl aminopeptidase/acylaminoacyl peptidase